MTTTFVQAHNRLVAALDPQGDVDRGLFVAILQQLHPDAAAVLAELVDKRVAAERERIAAGLQHLARHVMDADIQEGLDLLHTLAAGQLPEIEVGAASPSTEKVPRPGMTRTGAWDPTC